ncbi:MAG: 4-(cytidine 5'-diphospho)-2-C-methyl-D-erythritol kinase [Alcaligenaceae bacterium]|nr:4-(cytidine 5'-diphospho)-2-C-methyl-D-erythritol kinase [Alcaligenaceae bacterium]
MWHCVSSPAKLNLFLHVVGQRADGYHLLESLFVPIALSDTLNFCVSENQVGQIHLDLKSHINQSDALLHDMESSDFMHNNLVMRAALLLQKLAVNKGFSLEQLPSVNIQLDKYIPMGAGLGGGSSNAASTLMTLNRLWSLKLSQSELMSLGLSLGADVPFFLQSSAAFVEGIGEHITPLSIPKKYVLIYEPNQKISTVDVFKSVTLKRDCKSVSLNDVKSYYKNFNDGDTLSEAVSDKTDSSLDLWGDNVLQAEVLRQYPELKRLYDCVRDLEVNIRMSGSGSCFFSLFNTEKEARHMMAYLSHDLDALIASNGESILHKIYLTEFLV